LFLWGTTQGRFVIVFQQSSIDSQWHNEYATIEDIDSEFEQNQCEFSEIGREVLIALFLTGDVRYTVEHE